MSRPAYEQNNELRLPRHVLPKYDVLRMGGRSTAEWQGSLRGAEEGVNVTPDKIPPISRHSSQGVGRSSPERWQLVQSVKKGATTVIQVDTCLYRYQEC